MTALLNLKNTLIALVIIASVAIGLVWYVSHLRDKNSALSKDLNAANATIALMQREAARSAKAKAVINKQDNVVRRKQTKAKARIAKAKDDALPDVIREALKEIAEDQ